MVVRANRSLSASHSSQDRFGRYRPGMIQKVLASDAYQEAVGPDETVCRSCKHFEVCRENGMVRPSEGSRRDQGSPFRCMMMINMGRAYSLNRDGFVYALAIGTETNWKGDVYLARVRKQDLLKYAAWQYYTGLANGQPAWSQAQKDAVPVPNLFATDQGSAIYHPGVKRYLFLTLSHLFEAPAPWGPWTLAGDFPYDKPEWQRGYQPGIISKGLGSNSFWFTISSQNRTPYLTYSFHIGQMVMHPASQAKNTR